MKQQETLQSRTNPTTITKETTNGMRVQTPARRVYCMLFALLFIAYAYFHQGFKGGIATSRLDLLHSLCLKGSFAIDDYHRNTPDKAIHNGHYFSDKPPGTVVLSLPSFAVSVTLLQCFGIPPDSDSGWIFTSWFTTALSAGVLTAFGGVVLFACLCKCVRPRLAMVTVLGMFLGSAPFPYATILFSHGIVIALLAYVFCAVTIPSTTFPLIMPVDSPIRYFLAGCVSGIVVSCEYSAALVSVCIFLFVCTLGTRRALYFALGSIGPLMLIPLYHWICFQDPFTITYLHEAEYTQMSNGFFGITFPPDPDNVCSLLIGPTRGLFFWSPLFLMAFLGYSELFKRSRNIFYLTYITPILHILTIAGYYQVSAGPCLGPRLLSPILPLLSLPVALGILQHPRVGCGLAFISILLTGSATAISALPPPDIFNPLTDFYPEMLRTGTLTYNLGTVFGIDGHASLFPLLLVGVLLGVRLWRSVE